MIELQKHNLLKCTNYTKGGTKRNRNVESLGLLRFSVTAVNHNHHFSFKYNMDLVVDARSFSGKVMINLPFSDCFCIPAVMRAGLQPVQVTGPSQDTHI